MPIYFQEIFGLMGIEKKLSVRQIETELKTIKDKMTFLLGRTDSFYACHFFKKTQKYEMRTEWVLYKRNHEIFFYNTRDSHSHEGKLIRKKKKINV